MPNNNKKQWNIKDLSYLNTHDRLENYYRNSSNSIEDPLFTGFTLAIDNVHSPLFTSCCGAEVIDSLRSSSGNNTDIATAMEESLKEMFKVHIYPNPDTYEITTLGAKDSIGDRLAGYGLQDKFYLDNPIYGAVDYIYMVDKVSKSRYNTDFLGVSDIGNGGSARNTYEKDVDVTARMVADATLESTTAYMNEVLEKSYIDEETGEWVEPDDVEVKKADIDGAFDKEIAKKEVEMKKNEAAHLVNVSAVNVSKAVYDAGKKELEGLEESLSKLESSYKEQSTEIEKEFEQMQADAEKYYKILNRSTSSESNIRDAENQISILYAKYSELIEYCNNNGTSAEYSKKYKYLDVKFNVPSNSEVQKEVDKLKKKDEDDVTIDEPKENEEKKEDEKFVIFKVFDTKNVYFRIFQITKTSIKTNSLNSSLEKDIKKQKEAIEKKTKELYGVHPDGRLGSPGDPGILENGKPSPCLTFTEAQKRAETDTYSKMSYELSELKDTKENREYITKYVNAQYNKQQVSKAMPDIDYTRKDKETDDQYSDRINAAKNSRELFEVPQTVYDMVGFTEGMRALTTEYPYVLQSVTGLDEAYKNYFLLKDPYQGSGDGKITIQCLEFLDMRVSSMFNKYFNAVYDRQFKRERVPINLRRFECSIFVHDIRNFKNALGNKPSKDLGEISTILEVALNYVSVIEFKFYDCEIVPEETGGIFDSVSNISAGEMKNTNFTFTYGNCVINFLPFADLKQYLNNEAEPNNGGIRTRTTNDGEGNNTNVDEYTTKETFTDENTQVLGKSVQYSVGENREKINNKLADITSDDIFEESISKTDDGNFRRWFDRSDLGNVSNNDYREYIRHDSNVAVDDHYKTTIVNNFALNSVVDKNKELTAMDDALRRIVVGISASTGIPASGVADALNIQNIKPFLTEQDRAVAVVKDLGNVTNSKIINTDTTEYIGTVIDDEEHKPEVTTDLGNVNKEKGGN